MKNVIVSIVVAALVAVGIVTFTHKTAPNPLGPPLGASSGTENYQTQHFYQGFNFGSPTLSSSSPAALAGKPNFFITATTTTQNASSTLINSSNAMVFWQFASTTPIAGTTCNSGAPATSTVTIIASSTAPSVNGFVLNMSSAASGASFPYCVQGYIVPSVGF